MREVDGTTCGEEYGRVGTVEAHPSKGVQRRGGACSGRHPRGIRRPAAWLENGGRG